MAEKIDLNNLVIDKILYVSWDDSKTWHHPRDEQSENWSGEFESPSDAIKGFVTSVEKSR